MENGRTKGEPTTEKSQKYKLYMWWTPGKAAGAAHASVFTRDSNA